MQLLKVNAHTAGKILNITRANSPIFIYFVGL